MGRAFFMDYYPKNMYSPANNANRSQGNRPGRSVRGGSKMLDLPDRLRYSQSGALLEKNVEVFPLSEDHVRPRPEYGRYGIVLGKLVEGWGKLRRYYLSHFRRAYVESMRRRRRGSCRQCASCCAVMFKCPYLKGNKCQVYEDRFEQCIDFPIDERDLVFREKICHFWFEKG
jgi:hypothetical protein